MMSVERLLPDVEPSPPVMDPVRCQSPRDSQSPAITRIVCVAIVATVLSTAELMAMAAPRPRRWK